MAAIRRDYYRRGEKASGGFLRYIERFSYWEFFLNDPPKAPQWVPEALLHERNHRAYRGRYETGKFHPSFDGIGQFDNATPYRPRDPRAIFDYMRADVRAFRSPWLLDVIETWRQNNTQKSREHLRLIMEHYTREDGRGARMKEALPDEIQHDIEFAENVAAEYSSITTSSIDQVLANNFTAEGRGKSEHMGQKIWQVYRSRLRWLQWRREHPGPGPITIVTGRTLPEMHRRAGEFAVGFLQMLQRPFSRGGQDLKDMRESCRYCRQCVALLRERLAKPVPYSALKPLPQAPRRKPTP